MLTRVGDVLDFELVVFGFAPGTATIKCARCAQLKGGCDKSAVRCRECAVAMQKARAAREAR